MKKCTYLLAILFLVFSLQTGIAQDKEIAKSKIEELQSQKAGIKNAERGALKIKVERINEQLEKESITQEIADEQKKEAAELHAANIDDRLAILDKQIALLQRNNNLLNEVIDGNGRRVQFGFGHKNANDERLFGLTYKRKKPRPFEYDKRMHSDFVVSLGNNFLVGKNSYYDIGFTNETYYFELGWAWRYRLNKENNRIRLQYGITYQSNRFGRSELLFKPEFGNYGDENNGVVEQNPSDWVVSKTKLISKSLIFPFHLETGPSKLRKTESSIRYSIKNKFRLGFGGYLGLNLGVTQQVEGTAIPSAENSGGILQSYQFMRGLEKDRFIYGVSMYIGAGSFLFYTKFDLSTLYTYENNNYKIATVGLRVDM